IWHTCPVTQFLSSSDDKDDEVIHPGLHVSANIGVESRKQKFRTPPESLGVNWATPADRFRDKSCLRVTVLLTSSLMVLGAGLRCIPVSDLEIRKKLIHGGQLLNGLAGPTVMNAAPFLSTTWFSPDERATATAIASLLNYLGSAAAFLVGPLVVPSPNGTSHLLLLSQSNTEHIKDRIEAVLYAEFGMVSLIFSAALAYFPSRPPFPPSVAAASQRLSYRRSFCRLLSNFRFLMIALAYAIPLGVFSGWSGVLDLILTPVHVSQVDAGWIGFWSIVGGCVVGIAMAR
ncbi:PREDICTED: disrupted in renal carcinoma protein 2 homolog, partial [Buceros rhinoceros silvestris]|uniref:disrupted in renal carcinoma protein 2 homolog n=1 Tax=Buceros rhinoceros silvestris TaxID=175836 RepID=UPI0005292411